jgi:hypothetical protein
VADEVQNAADVAATAAARHYLGPLYGRTA